MSDLLSRRVATGALVLCGLLPHAGAQTFPTRPVKVVVPFPAGSATDLVVRLMTESLVKELGQPVIVENRAGAGGNIGAEFVSKQPPDGYTILMGTTANMAVNKTLVKNLPYDPASDFTPLSIGHFSCNYLVVPTESSIRSVAGLIAEAKANPGKLNFGSSGIGTAAHLAGEWFKSITGTELTHVPYKSGPEALNDLVAGRIELDFEPIATAMPFIRAGKLRPLAGTCKERLSALPDVPTLMESGVKDYDLRGWSLFVAPPRLPEAIAKRWSDALSISLRSPKVREGIEALNMQPSPSTPAVASAFLKDEIAKWGQIVRAARLQVD